MKRTLWESSCENERIKMNKSVANNVLMGYDRRIME
jgi:hypothetical protein